jgi:hypothetical protein
MIYFYLLNTLLLAFLISGCGPNSSTHSGEKEVNVRLDLDIHDNAGPVYVNPDFGLKYAQGDTTQDTKNSSTQAPITDLKIPIAQGAASAATGAMEAVENVLDNSLKGSQNDNSDTNHTPDIGTGSDTENTPDEVELTGNKIALRPDKINGKNWTWLSMSGDGIGGPVVFSFPECKTKLEVDDPTNAWGADGNSENFNQSYYFSGNPDKQDDISTACSGGCASVFAPPGCTATYVLMDTM